MTAREQIIPFCDIPGLAGAACAAQEIPGAVAKSALDDLTEWMGEAFAWLLTHALAWWTQFPSPELATSEGGLAPVLDDIRSYTSQLQVLMLIAGLLFAGARLTLAQRGGLAGEAQETVLMLARAILASMAFATVITAGTRAGDAFAEWVIYDVTSSDVEAFGTGFVRGFLAATGGMNPGALFLLFAACAISMLVQLVMLVVRQALLIVVVAVLPIAAASSGTGPGSQAYKRLLAWSLAAVLWKPVGSLVYAMAFTAAGDPQDSNMALLGLILLAMSVIVLPALIRLVAPAVATLGGGGGAAATVAGGLIGVGMAGASARREGRRVGQAGAGGGGQGAAPPPPPLGGGAGGGGGRPMPSGGAGSSTSGSGAGLGKGSGGGGASPQQAPSVPPAGAGGKAAAAASAAPQLAKGASSLAGSQGSRPAASGPDQAQPGSLEVRR
ncbi:hypothetical protein [Nocardia bhagyanarayanae]|uniref:TrbL/VirB6 plasmid conjugal transfer protein n=1 Tax=Nocardia bhagyanarayanae TaxID=1215925 RepID=A0A543FFN9_9NOCA|nr:hypothetical protein [Nocardia bhagyanarayanae]TQM32680.1 hypothetical protein FB390_4375 [Nocardia bhagyanarayanae]